jgi:hypothetical protein
MTKRTEQARVIRSDAMTIDRLKAHREEQFKQMMLLPRGESGWMMMRSASLNVIINLLLDEVQQKNAKKGSK